MSVTKLENWEKRRAAMQDVCSNCHAPGWVDNFYEQYESTVALYNEKFAKPAQAVMDKLYASGKLTRTPFDEKLEWYSEDSCAGGHQTPRSRPLAA
ncbi:MAG TPA: hypothetical protein VE398_01590, partial [Acidobacteriota bacterium]|nr:hypothetical protein [Acidobacteriota bacterium]